MDIYQVTENKKQYLDLLLLADEQEDMIDRYLEAGDMYILDDQGVKGECVVTDEGDGVLELKNIAIYPEQQKQGYGQALIEHIVARYKGRYHTLRVGTGDIPWIIRFYEKCGFKRSGLIKNFFTDNYGHPMFEDGRQLVDMIYLSRGL